MNRSVVLCWLLGVGWLVGLAQSVPAPVPAPARPPAQASNSTPASGAVAAASPVVPADAFVVHPLDLLPPSARVRILPVRFPAAWPVAQVQGLGTAAGRLWIQARGLRQTNGTGGKLWVYSPQADRMDPLLGRLEAHEVFDLKTRREGVWLALDGGAALIDPETLVVDPFGAAEGLTSPDVLGFAGAGRQWFAFSRPGALHVLNANGRGWSRAGDTGGRIPRKFSPWRRLAGSGDWILVAGDETLLARHQAGAEFEELRPKLWQGLASVTPPQWTAVAGDGDGGFWLGSDLGLHFVLPETGSGETLPAPQSVQVAGGLQILVPPGHRPSAAAYDAARTRMATEIRNRMRTRARLSRLAVELNRPLDPVTPASRLPGGVRALLADGGFLWVAARVGTNGQNTEVMLFHPPSRKWVARFGVPAAVTAMAVDEEHLWLGCDLTGRPQAAPVLRVDRRPLVGTPPARWATDELTGAELGVKLAGMPVRDRAVLAFFAGQGGKVIELLEGQFEDAEALFLLAFARESAASGPDPARDKWLGQLQERFPQSPFAEATRSLRTAGLGRAPAGIEAMPVPEVEVPPLDRLFRRRDRNNDGKVDLDEFRIWRGPEAELGAFDTDGDGLLGISEFEAVLRAGK